MQIRPENTASAGRDSVKQKTRHQNPVTDPFHSYGTSPAIWDHRVLPATRHRRTRPALTSARHAG